MHDAIEHSRAGELWNVRLKYCYQDSPYAFEGDHVLFRDYSELPLARIIEGLEANIEFYTEAAKIH